MSPTWLLIFLLFLQEVVSPFFNQVQKIQLGHYPLRLSGCVLSEENSALQRSVDTWAIPLRKQPALDQITFLSYIRASFKIIVEGWHLSYTVCKVSIPDFDINETEVFMPLELHAYF